MVTTRFEWVSPEVFAQQPVGRATRGKHVALWCTSRQLIGGTWVGAFDAEDVTMLAIAANADHTFESYDSLLDARLFSGFTPAAFVEWMRCSRNYENNRKGRLRTQVSIVPRAMHLAAMCYGFGALLKPSWIQEFASELEAGCALINAREHVPGLETLAGSLLRGSQTLAHLSKREKQIVMLAIQGYSDLNIATRLDLAEATIGSHMNRIFRRLRVHSRVELAARCQDLLPPSEQ